MTNKSEAVPPRTDNKQAIPQNQYIYEEGMMMADSITM